MEVKAWAGKKRRGEKGISVARVLNLIGLSKSGFFGWIKRKPSKQKERREKITNLIKKIWRDSKFIYGSAKIAHELWKRGQCVSIRTVGIYMRQLGIRASWVKKFTHKAKSFGQNLCNILEQKFNPERPDAFWCTDITYILDSRGFRVSFKRHRFVLEENNRLAAFKEHGAGVRD